MAAFVRRVVVAWLSTRSVVSFHFLGYKTSGIGRGGGIIAKEEESSVGIWFVRRIGVAWKHGAGALSGAAIIIALIVLAYSNIIFLGESLVSTANYHPFDDSGAHLRPVPTRSPPFLTWHDQGVSWWQWEPAAKFFSHWFRRGDVPLWDPTVAGGVDAHVNVTQGQYFPPYALMLLMGDTAGLRDAYYLLLIVVAGLAIYAFLLANGLSAIGAAAAGVSYSLGGTITQNVNSITGQSYAVLPLVVLAADLALRKRTRRAVAAGALLVSLAPLSSFLPVAISGYVLIGFLYLSYVLTALRKGEYDCVKPLTSVFAVVVVVSLALSAFLLVPFFAASRHVDTVQEAYRGIGLIDVQPEHLLELVSPTISYDVNRRAEGAQVFPRKHATGVLFYVGIIPLLLAVSAIPQPEPQRRLYTFGVLVTGFVLLKLLGVAPVQWLGYLPPFNQVHFVPYFCGALNVGISVLAGVATDNYVAGTLTKKSRLVLAVVVLMLFCYIIDFALNHHPLPVPSRKLYLVELLWISGMAGGLMLVQWLRYTGRLQGSVAGSLIIAAIALQLLPFAYHRRYLRKDVWSDPPDYVRYLQSDHSLFRIHSIDAYSLTPNSFQGVNISGLGSRHVIHSNRYVRLLRATFRLAEPAQFIVPVSLLPSNRSVLDLLNVKYIITRNPLDSLPLEKAGLQSAFRSGSYWIYRNPTVFPRAYLTNTYVEASSPQDALARTLAMREPDRVVVEQRPSFAGPKIKSGPGTVKVLRYTPDLLEFKCATDTPAILVVLDNDAPGWSATVNGKPMPILRANFAFRGVEVPRGITTVRFGYVSPLLRASTAVSTIAAAASLLVLVWPARRRLRAE